MDRHLCLFATSIISVTGDSHARALFIPESDERIIYKQQVGQ